MFKHGAKNMRIKTKLPLNSNNLSKSFYIIVIILPLSLFVCCAAVQNSEAVAGVASKVRVKRGAGEWGCPSRVGRNKNPLKSICCRYAIKSEELYGMKR